MVERTEGFLDRWARLKKTKREERDAGPGEVVNVQPAAALTPEASQDAEAPDLPAIESLNKDSDYTGFLRAGVAPELRRQALGKLWRSDPVFANLDGLLEYGEDYSRSFGAPAAIATAYRVGQGMMASMLDSNDAASSGTPAARSEAAGQEDGAPMEFATAKDPASEARTEADGNDVSCDQRTS